MKIEPKAEFDYSNFDGISKIGDEYYIVLTQGYLAKVKNGPTGDWSEIYPPILYPSVSVVEMPVSQIVENGETQKFEVSVDLTDDTNGKYTEAYLYIETSSAEPSQGFTLS